MFVVKGVKGLALFAVLMMACSANATAQTARQEVRDELFSPCDDYKGGDKRACKRQARQAMREMAEEARRAFRECIREGNGREVCQGVREASWEENLVY